MPAAVGTLARIVDFYTMPDGLLGIAPRAASVSTSTVRACATTAWRMAQCGSGRMSRAVPMPPEFVLAGHDSRTPARNSPAAPFAKAHRARYDDASWVGFRLAESLPLENRERQHLLQITDPLERLGQLMHYLPRFQNA